VLGSDYPGYQDYKLRVAHFRQERAYRLSWDNAQCSHERFEGSDHTELYSGENTNSDVDEWDVRQGSYNSDESDMWDEVGVERVPLGNIYDITINYGSD